MRNFVAIGQRRAAVPEGRQPGPDPPGPGEATAGGLRARRACWPAEPASTCCGSTATSAGPSSTTPPTATGSCSGRTCRCSGATPGVRRQAVRQAREAVDLLGHHPSIAIWCGHNEPVAVDIDPAGVEPDGSPPGTAARPASPPARSFPTWNKTVLDRSIRRTLEKADGSRPVVAHSGVLPHPAWGTDTHLYFGWYHGEERDLPAAAGPDAASSARFVSEFGAQAVPEHGRVLRARALARSRLGPPGPGPRPAEGGLRPAASRPATTPASTAGGRHPGLPGRADPPPRRDAAPAQVPTDRRLLPVPASPTASPPVSWSVLDHERVPKAGYDALAAACAPVIVVADRLAPSYHAGTDPRPRRPRRERPAGPPSGNRSRARLTWPGGPVPGPSAATSKPTAVPASACCARPLPAEAHAGPAHRSNSISSGLAAGPTTPTRATCRLSPTRQGPNRRGSAPSPYCLRGHNFVADEPGCRAAHDAEGTGP